MWACVIGKCTREMGSRQETGSERMRKELARETIVKLKEMQITCVTFGAMVIDCFQLAIASYI